MLILLADLAQAIIAQAKRDHPLESCGVIAAPLNSAYPTRLIPMRNAAQSSEFFRFDASEQFRVWQEMAARDEEPRILYHSHTGSAAYPSREDVACAGEPDAHYVIISTDSNCQHNLRSFRIQAGKVVEETIKLLESYPTASPAPAGHTQHATHATS